MRGGGGREEAGVARGGELLAGRAAEATSSEALGRRGVHVERPPVAEVRAVLGEVELEARHPVALAVLAVRDDAGARNEPRPCRAPIRVVARVEGARRVEEAHVDEGVGALRAGTAVDRRAHDDAERRVEQEQVGARAEVDGAVGRVRAVRVRVRQQGVADQRRAGVGVLVMLPRLSVLLRAEQDVGVHLVAAAHRNVVPADAIAGDKPHWRRRRRQGARRRRDDPRGRAHDGRVVREAGQLPDGAAGRRARQHLRAHVADGADAGACVPEVVVVARRVPLLPPQSRVGGRELVLCVGVLEHRRGRRRGQERAVHATDGRRHRNAGRSFQIGSTFAARPPNNDAPAWSERAAQSPCSRTRRG